QPLLIKLTSLLRNFRQRRVHHTSFSMSRTCLELQVDHHCLLLRTLRDLYAARGFRTYVGVEVDILARYLLIVAVLNYHGVVARSQTRKLEGAAAVRHDSDFACVITL